MGAVAPMRNSGASKSCVFFSQATRREKPRGHTCLRLFQVRGPVVSPTQKPASRPPRGLSEPRVAGPARRAWRFLRAGVFCSGPRAPTRAFCVALLSFRPASAPAPAFQRRPQRNVPVWRWRRGRQGGRCGSGASAEVAATPQFGRVAAVCGALRGLHWGRPPAGSMGQAVLLEFAG